MRTRYIATFAETIRTDPVTLAREYLSARDATEHEFQTDEARDAYVDVLSALGRFQHRAAFARALAQLDAPATPTKDDRENLPLRPIAWSFGEGPTFAGFTDDTTWNGFLNVLVPVSTWPYVLAELIAGAEGDAATIEEYKRLRPAKGLVCISHGFTTSEVKPEWTMFFPDFPIETMVPIPETWSNMSWRHETAPSFGPCVGPMGEAAQIWIDYEQPSMREFPELGRFTFSRRDAVGELTVVYAGDDYDEALGHVAIESLACSFANRLAEQLEPSDWQEMRLRNRTIAAATCASHDFVDANIAMLEAWRETRAAGRPEDADAEAMIQDLKHVNAAWAIATRCYLTASEEGARFDEWRTTGRDVQSLSAEGIDLGTVPPSDSAGRAYSAGFMEANGKGWIVNVGNSSKAFVHLIDAEQHLWSTYASVEYGPSERVHI
jgi:hypothetical protein